MDHPKSALVDRTKKLGHENPPQERSIHVKFAKMGAKSVESSMASVVPTLKAKKGEAHQGPSKDPPGVKGHGTAGGKTNTANSSGESSKKAKSNSVAPPRPAKTMTKPTSHGPSKGSSRTPNAKGKYVKNRTALVTPVDRGAHLQDKKSVETLVSTAEMETIQESPPEKVIKTKSKKLYRASKPKSLVKVSNTVKKVKSKLSKQLKKPGEDPIEKNLSKIKVDTEYVSELTKITKILREVSAFDATTSTQGGGVEGGGGSSTRVGVYNHTAEGYDGLSETSVKRPLSTGELKQILTSITRVVSLHQLPVDGQAGSSSTQQDAAGKGSSYSGSKIKRRNRKKPKSPSKTTTSEEVDKDKAKTGTKVVSKSKDFLRNSRSRKKFESVKENTRKLAGSQASSASSPDRDHPARNAAFLKAYIEESNRLEGKVMNEDGEVIPRGDAPLVTPVENLSEAMEQTKEKPVSVGDSNNKTASTNGTGVGNQAETKIVGPQFNLSRKGDPDTTKLNRTKFRLDNQDRLDNLSTKAVSGSPKPEEREPTGKSGSAEKVLGKRTPIVDPTGRKAARMVQLSNLEGVINSKFKGNTTKMKSMWEKAPSLPGSASDAPSSLDSTNRNERKGHRTVYGKIAGYFDKVNITPWSVTDQLIEETPLQMPFRPQSGMSSAFNKLRTDFSTRPRTDDRQIQRRYRDSWESRGISSRPQTGLSQGLYGPREALKMKTIDDTLKFLESQGIVGKSK